MANGKKWWQRPWVWIVAIPVVIVGALTTTHQPTPTATSAADQAPSITITSSTTPPTAVPTTTTVVVPTTTTTVPPPPPTHTKAVVVPPPAVPAPPVAAPPVAAPPVAAGLCGATANPLGSNYCGRGQLIVAPSPDTCSYFRCIANWSNGRGHMEECEDGDVSMSGGIQGSCSYHGGNLRAVYQG